MKENSERPWFRIHLNTACICMLVAATVFGRTVCGETKENDKLKNAKELIIELGSEEFKVREAAEKKLKNMGPDILDLIRGLSKNSSDVEVRTRCVRIYNALILAHGTDVKEVTTLARDAVLAGRYQKAAQLYSKAEKLYLAQYQNSMETQPYLEQREGEVSPRENSILKAMVEVWRKGEGAKMRAKVQNLCNKLKGVQNQELETRIFRFAFMKIDNCDLLACLARLKGPNCDMHPMKESNALIVRDYPENLDAMQELITKFDRKPKTFVIVPEE